MNTFDLIDVEDTIEARICWFMIQGDPPVVHMPIQINLRLGFSPLSIVAGIRKPSKPINFNKCTRRDATDDDAAG